VGVPFAYENLEWPDDKPVILTLRSAVVGKGIEHPRGRCRSLIRLWGRIEFIEFYCARIGFVRLLPTWSLPGNGCGLAVGGFGRRHHRCEPGLVLSGASPHVVTFSEGLCIRSAGRARFFVSYVVAVQPFSYKAAWDLTIGEAPWSGDTDLLTLTSFAGIPDESAAPSCIQPPLCNLLGESRTP